MRGRSFVAWGSDLDSGRFNSAPDIGCRDNCSQVVRVNDTTWLVGFNRKPGVPAGAECHSERVTVGPEAIGERTRDTIAWKTLLLIGFAIGTGIGLSLSLVAGFVYSI